MGSRSRKHAGLIIGIDATNLRGGGGVTHLLELLNVAEPANHGIAKIIIWGGKQTLQGLPEFLWLEKISPSMLNRGLLFRIFWQRFLLSMAARKMRCNVLFIPGGSYFGNFRPVVTMSQNLLPFEWSELRRYGWSLTALKFILLRFAQSHGFMVSDGVIFLTEYARDVVLKAIGTLTCSTAIIPHGLSPRFLMLPKEQRPISQYSASNPYRVLYVSTIDRYKHQWEVVKAIYALRQEGYPLALELAGGVYPPALALLKATMARLDPDGLWVDYHGAVPYEKLHTLYMQADLGLFASSCETFSIILLESMAAGLPIACSNRSAAPEVLGDTGLYFNPENSDDIAQALRTLIENPELRNEKAQSSFVRSQQFLWTDCSGDTLSFLANIAKKSLLKRAKYTSSAH